MLKFKLEICQLIGAISGSQRVGWIKVNKLAKTMEAEVCTLGRVGAYEFRYDLPLLALKRSVLLIPNIKKAPELGSYPGAEIVPNLHALAAYLINESPELKTYIIAWNPAGTFFTDDAACASVERVITACRNLENAVFQNQAAAAPTVLPPLEAGGLNENHSVFHTEPVSKFLFETLMKRQRLLARNGVTYLALRQWRKTIKPYQISALEAIKSDEMPICVEKVADEIVETVNKVYGKLFTGIVPVPGGSSGRARSFSVMLAEAVAARLKIPLEDILVGSPVAPGASHPKKSAVLKPYTLRKNPSDYVLIVDDVATSGKHIEMATLALRDKTKYCTAVAWIAD